MRSRLTPDAASHAQWLINKLVAAVEAFVHDIGRKIAAQAAAAAKQEDEQDDDEQPSASVNTAVVTPVQLYVRS